MKYFWMISFSWEIYPDEKLSHSWISYNVSDPNRHKTEREIQIRYIFTADYYHMKLPRDLDYNQGSPVTKKTFPSQMTVTVLAWPWLTFWSLSWSFWPLAFGSSSTTFSIVFFSTNLPVGNFSISSFIDAKIDLLDHNSSRDPWTDISHTHCFIHDFNTSFSVICRRIHCKDWRCYQCYSQLNYQIRILGQNVSPESWTPLKTRTTI